MARSGQPSDPGARWSAPRCRSRASIPAPPSSPRAWPPTTGSAGSSRIGGSRSRRWASPTRRARAAIAASDDVARECLRLNEGAVLDEPPGLPSGAGPVWTGGFAFDADGAGILGLVLVRAGLADPVRSSRSAGATTNASSPGTWSSLRAMIAVASAERVGGAARRPAYRPPADARSAPDRPSRDSQRAPAQRLRSGRHRRHRADRPG